MTESSKFAAKLGPISIGIRKDLVFTRQELGGGTKYIVHDPITFKNHAFSPLEYRIMSAIVLGRSLAKCFESLASKDVLRARDEDAFYSFVLSLHGKHLLQLPISQPEILFERHNRRQAARQAGWYRSVFYFKIPVLSPDRFLESTIRYFGWLFSGRGVQLWAGLVFLMLWKCWGRLGEMAGETGRLLELANLPVMWITLVLLKVVHEFGHAYATKKFGGEVPEMGLAFILMTPCAYVDAGASWKFSSRWQRIAVGMAGMYVESFVAAAFALVWASTPPGLLHDVALNVMVLASAVTVLFNINPLMRYDGYYVFSDLFGVANLRDRSDRFLKSRVKKVLLGLPSKPVVTGAAEKALHWLYGPSSAAYKAMLALSITRMVITRWPMGGVVLGILCIWMMMITPVKRAFGYLWRGEETAPVRVRARVVAVATVGLLLFALTGFPISSHVVGAGFLETQRWISVRAPLDSFVDDVYVRSGMKVHGGQPVCTLVDPALDIEAIRTRGKLVAERARLEATELVDRAAAVGHRARFAYLQKLVKAVEGRERELHLQAVEDGTIVGRQTEELRGRFVQRGEELFQLHAGRPMLRVVFDAEELTRARLRPGVVAEVRWSVDPSHPITAIVREIRPSASRTDLPAAVTLAGGGDLFVHAGARGRPVADRPYVHLFLEPDSVPDGIVDGLTARVRLPAESLTLAGWLRHGLLTFYHAWKMS